MFYTLIEAKMKNENISNETKLKQINADNHGYNSSLELFVRKL
jgi:hypothetical protein